jgi:predicted Kef-type K+ transport protein
VVVEDLFTVLALVMLPALVGASSGPAPLWQSLVITALKV